MRKSFSLLLAAVAVLVMTSVANGQESSECLASKAAN